MATAYSRDDPGAPALPYSGSSSVGACFLWIKEMLRACLVQGYSGKPAAGWELISESSTHLVIRNGTHTGYFCLTVTGGLIKVWLSETFISASSGVIVGDGLVSGGSNASRQVCPASYLSYASGAASWYVVADNRSFMCCAAGHYANRDIGASWTDATNGLSLYGGEDSEGNFVSVGGGYDPSYPGVGPSFLGFTSLKNPETGLLRGGDSLTIYTPLLALNRDAVARPTSDTALKLAHISLVPSTWSSGSYVARLRGLAHVPELLAASSSGIAKSLGVPAGLTLRTLATPLYLGDSHTYFAGIIQSGKGYGGYLVTTNPEFW